MNVGEGVPFFVGERAKIQVVKSIDDIQQGYSISVSREYMLVTAEGRESILNCNMVIFEELET